MKKDILVLIGMLIVIGGICLVLPDKIAIHYNIHGEPTIVVNKYLLLLGVPIPYSLYWQFFRKKQQHKYYSD